VEAATQVNAPNHAKLRGSRRPHYSHSIVEQEVSSLFYKHKSPHLTDISRWYIRCNFSISNSQDNLRCSKYRRYGYLSETIDE